MRWSYLKDTDDLFYPVICWTTAPYMLENMRLGHIINYSHYTDDEITATIIAVDSSIGKDDAKVIKTIGEITPQILDVA